MKITTFATSEILVKEQIPHSQCSAPAALAPTAQAKAASSIPRPDGLVQNGNGKRVTKPTPSPDLSFSGAIFQIFPPRPLIDYTTPPTTSSSSFASLLSQLRLLDTCPASLPTATATAI